MSGDLKSQDPDYHRPPGDDEEPLTLQVDWSIEEEVRAKRKYVLVDCPVRPRLSMDANRTT